jgi:hypothetical protein
VGVGPSFNPNSIRKAMRMFQSGFGTAAIVLMGMTASAMAQAATAPTSPQAMPIPLATVQAIASTPALSLQSTATATSALVAPASGLQIDLSGPVTR